jgi:RNA-dependent RNA polymerase
MMKGDKIRYVSTKVLGKLYRQCQELQRSMQRDGTLDCASDKELTSVLTYREKQDAISQRDIYNAQLSEIMNMYGLEKESEAITGMVQILKRSRGCLKDEKFQVGKTVREKVSLLRTKTRKEFFKEFGGEKPFYSDGLTQMILEKASAWYTVTYESMTNFSHDFLSFPWVVADILCLRKKTQMNNPVYEIEQSLERRMKLFEED